MSKHQGLRAPATLMAQTSFPGASPTMPMAREPLSDPQGHQTLPFLAMDLVDWGPCPRASVPSWPCPAPVPREVPGAGAAGSLGVGWDRPGLPGTACCPWGPQGAPGEEVHP